MDDLITRLTAAIADTEDVAQHALSAGWHVNITIDVDPKAAAEHAIRHDPTSVLRGCAADRKILAMHEQTKVFRAGDPPVWECNRCGYGESWPCDTILAVAERYGLEAGDG